MEIKHYLRLLFLCLCFSINMHTKAQNCQWANQIGLINSNTKLNAICKYSGDNIIIAGSFTSPTLTFNSHTLTNSGQEDAFFVVMDKNGNYLWANKIGGLESDNISNIVSDSMGNIYVAGTYYSLSLTIGSSVLINSGESDGFLVKFNSNNTVEWARNIGTNLADVISGLGVDSSGNVYVSGHSSLHPIYNVFVKKYDNNNNLLWEVSGTTDSVGFNSMTSTSLTLDDNQNVYLSGSFYGYATFSNTHTIGYGTQSGFIVKYNSAGLYMSGIADTSLTQVNDITSLNNELFTCGEKMTWRMGWGWPLQSSKIYVTKLDSALNKIWQKENGGVSSSIYDENYDLARAITVDAFGNSYVAGFSFSDTLHFANTTLLNEYYISYYYPQAFVLKYGPTGDELWGNFFGGHLLDEATIVMAASNENFYYGGMFESDTITFDSHVLENSGEVDSIYVHISPIRFGKKQVSFISYFENDSTINIDELNKSMKISLFPNPANDFFFIKFLTKPVSGTKVSIYSIDGRLIRSDYHNSPFEILKVDANEIASGIYFVVVDSKNNRAIHKLIRE